MAIAAMLGDRVLLRLDKEKEKIGALYVPETAKDKPQTATVIAVGPGLRDGTEHIPPIVQIGDKVMFGKYSGSEIEIDGEMYLAIHESDLILILAEEPQPPQSG